MSVNASVIDELRPREVSQLQFEISQHRVQQVIRTKRLLVLNLRPSAQSPQLMPVMPIDEGYAAE